MCTPWWRFDEWLSRYLLFSVFDFDVGAVVVYLICCQTPGLCRTSKRSEHWVTAQDQQSPHHHLLFQNRKRHSHVVRQNISNSIAYRIDYSWVSVRLCWQAGTCHDHRHEPFERQLWMTAIGAMTLWMPLKNRLQLVFLNNIRETVVTWVVLFLRLNDKEEKNDKKTTNSRWTSRQFDKRRMTATIEVMLAIENINKPKTTILLRKLSQLHNFW